VKSLSISEVEHWLLSKTNRFLSPLRKRAKNIVNDVAEYIKWIRKEIDSINENVKKMSKEGKFDKACKVALTFSEKLSELLDNFKLPDECDYKSLLNLRKTLDNFLRKVMELGSRYVPRMSTRTFKAPVLKIDYYIRNLYKIRKKLDEFLKAKYFHVKYVEEALDDVRKLLGEENKIKELQKEIEERENQLKKLLKVREELKKKVDEKREFLRTEYLTEQAYKVKNEIRNLLAPIDKALRKFLNLVDRGEIKLTREQEELLYRTDQLKNPAVSLEDAKVLKKLLESIKKLILSGKISLDKKKTRKTLNSIQLVLEEGLLDRLIENYMHLQETKRELEEKHRKDIENMKRLEEELMNVEKRINDLKEEVDFKEKEINDLRTEISTLKNDLEKRIEKIVNQPVEIILSSTPINEHIE